MGKIICRLGFCSRASCRNSCTARCWSIWYRFFIATLSFFLAEKTTSVIMTAVESRYFLRINGHPRTVFKIDTDGNETVLHSFSGGVRGYETDDGRNPVAGLVLDSQGNLYGTTFEGGTSNRGTVFKIDTNGNETVLLRFPNKKGGPAGPYGGVVLDAEGNLY